MRAPIVAGTAALVAALLGGCGEDNVPDEDTLALDLEVGGRVSIERTGFEPAEIRVQPGELVEFTNESDDEHTVTSDRVLIDSGPLLPGETFTYLADDDVAATVIEYHCALHPERLRGRIVVGTPRLEPPDA